MAADSDVANGTYGNPQDASSQTAVAGRGTTRVGGFRKTIRIARREYRAAVRTKGFIVGMLVGPLFMGGGIIVFALFKDRVDTSDKRLAVLDRSGLVAQAIAKGVEERNATEVFDPETGKKVKPTYFVEIVEPDQTDPDTQLLELSNRVRNGDIHAFVEISPGILHPRQDPEASCIAYYGKNPALDELRGWVAWPINGELRRLRLIEAGVEGSDVEDMFDWIAPEPLGLVSADTRTGEIKQAERHSRLEAILVPLIMPMIMFLLFMMGAVPHLNSVMEEKQQRIAEVMLGSVKPFQFMLGKLIGGVCVSLSAATVYVIGGIATMHYMELEGHIPYHLLPWFAAYTIMAIFMFGAMYAALGSACNDAAEAQSVSLLGMLPMIFPYFVQMPVVMQPQSAFATGLSLFPIFTPMLMLIRQGTPGGVPLWQPWIGLIGVALTTLFFVWIASRIFRVGILMQGTPPKLGNLVRWALRG